MRNHLLTALLAVVASAALLAGCAAGPQGKPGTFAAGDGVFLLNGEPFTVKAAEVHYTRIPEPYWEHRIEMCKALGMNTLCLYVFWNIHEQRPGEFDFSGQNDIARFCRLAQKHGLYVIVRPGPYVCAEWDMGGLPWWLLKKPDMEVRTLDPYFMERTRLFMREIGRQLADLQITRGGNIIMVQVENEYGSYGVDKPYVSAIRDIVREAGFTDVPLFQCDWSSNFTANGLDDLLWTINFGTGADIDLQFAELRRLRPHSPLMCSEFWSGWFDHWGRKHETRSADALVSGLRDMLDRGISFSLYMTHGGSTFGHWGGANSPAYSAMCSSYDYDAPISEAGRTTDKFYKIRELLAGYLPEGESPAAIPDPLPMITLPEIRFTERAPLFSTLPEPKRTERVKPMEEFDQGWGSILYRTQLPALDEPAQLVITELHDWAQVFVDGRLIGRLDRRHDQNSLVLPACPAGARLDILVEAMGRVNFSRTIHDRKGITERVELERAGRRSELTGWEVYNLPDDHAFAAGRRYGGMPDGAAAQEGPAYYRARFTVPEAGDTFLDMSSWGKGLVWVNGHCLGRFWEIGPQQTLYLPGCWLRAGKQNEIIVLDLKGPASASVSGLSAPILDLLRTEAPETHRRQGQTLRLADETPVLEGEFRSGGGWQEVTLPGEQGRYFCLEALSSQDGGNVAAIAELRLLDEHGAEIPREEWRVCYADSEETRSGNRTADKVYDLQESTFWQTVDNVSYPHALVIDLGREYTVGAVRCLPRAEVQTPGMIRGFRFYVKRTPFDC